MQVIYIAARLVMVLLTVLEVAMLIRAITSWIPSLDGAAWLDFVYMITDPIVVPVRALFEHFSFFRNSPIDFSFVIAYLLLGMVQIIVSHFTNMFF